MLGYTFFYCHDESPIQIAYTLSVPANHSTAVCVCVPYIIASIISLAHAHRSNWNRMELGAVGGGLGGQGVSINWET